MHYHIQKYILAAKIIGLTLFLVSCKNISKETSSNINTEIKKGFNTEIEEGLTKLDSCILFGNSDVFLYQDNPQEVLVDILDHCTIHIDKAKIDAEDFSSISLLCNNKDFFIVLNNNIGNNYFSIYHKFELNPNSKKIFWSKTFNTESTRQGIEVMGNIVKENILSKDYELIEKKTEKTVIYSFSGFQEGKEPMIDSYVDIIKSHYKTKNKESLSLVGDKFVLDFLLRNIRLTKENLSKYNDIAYYLEQSDAHQESIFLLEKIIKRFPERTVAYINIGDAYWGIGEKEKAKKAYITYVEQMRKSDKETKIPKRVWDISKEE